MCKYCIDMDVIYDIVCYIPTDNGSSIDVPVRYCPYCGRELYGLTYERVDDDGPGELNKIKEDVPANKYGESTKEIFTNLKDEGVWYDRFQQDR